MNDLAWIHKPCPKFSCKNPVLLKLNSEYVKNFGHLDLLVDCNKQNESMTVCPICKTGFTMPVIMLGKEVVATE